jgi:hypothetical protein
LRGLKVKADERFIRQPLTFWAHVRSISEYLGYTVRGKNLIRVPTLPEMQFALHDLSLNSHHIINEQGSPTILGQQLLDYYSFRADRLNNFVAPRLMNGQQARELFEALRAELNPGCPVPMNKQTGDKRAPAFLTGIVNMLIEANCEGFPCNYDPGQLTTVTRDGVPLRTLARRVDGAFTGVVNPIAIWEIKEYYYTTTFGSRVADGVYETLLDGMELEELAEHENVSVQHYLMVDAYGTWWVQGKSYLCRIFDMLHMGYVDEVLFGREVVERLPAIVKEWVTEARARGLVPERRQ